MEKIIAFLLTLFISIPGISQKINPDSIHYYLPKGFTGQIAIKKETKFIYTENFGFKERNFGVPINDSTVFNIGQVSHTMVRYFILHLESLGEIKQSDKVSLYIKNLPYDNILIKHLIKHQSGLPDSYIKFYHKKYYNDWNIKLNERQKRFDNDDIIYLLNQKKPKLQFEPGDSSKYSDFNYLILVTILEKVTNMPFNTFVNQLFRNGGFGFEPIVSAEKDTIYNKAWGYRLFPDSSITICDNLKSRGFYFNDGTNGNQHIYLSAKNLVLWGQFLLKDMNLNKLNSNRSKTSIDGFKYNKELKIIIKKGAFGGVYSKLIFTLENDLIIAIYSTLFEPTKKGKELNKLIKYLTRVY